MNNLSTTWVKVALLAGGAAIGAFLAHKFDEVIASRMQAQSEYDKARYAQGLAPLSSQPSTEVYQVEERREE